MTPLRRAAFVPAILLSSWAPTGTLAPAADPASPRPAAERASPHPAPEPKGPHRAAEPARPRSAPGSELRAVLVHGDGIDEPYLIHDPPTRAFCFYFFTYNLGDARATRAPASDRAVTFSYFTREDWLRWNEGGRPDGGLTAATARIHTRIVLAPPGTAPHVQYRKDLGLGHFFDRHRLEPAGELFFARLGIPTRLDADGNAEVRSDAVAAEVELSLPDGFACGIPGDAREGTPGADGRVSETDDRVSETDDRVPETDDGAPDPNGRPPPPNGRTPIPNEC